MEDPRLGHATTCPYPPTLRWWWGNGVRGWCTCRSQGKFSTYSGWITDKQTQGCTHPNDQGWTHQQAWKLTCPYDQGWSHHWDCWPENQHAQQTPCQRTEQESPMHHTDNLHAYPWPGQLDDDQENTRKGSLELHVVEAKVSSSFEQCHLKRHWHFASQWQYTQKWLLERTL